MLSIAGLPDMPDSALPSALSSFKDWLEIDYNSSLYALFTQEFHNQKKSIILLSFAGEKGYMRHSTVFLSMLSMFHAFLNSLTFLRDLPGL